jgi:probable addiction module antidote protein
MSDGVSKFDVTKYLHNETDIANYLQAAMEMSDPEFFQVALGTVARARGMSAVADDTGVGRSGLYKALDSKGNPSFSLIQKVISSLGMELTIVPKQQAKS